MTVHLNDKAFVAGHTLKLFLINLIIILPLPYPFLFPVPEAFRQPHVWDFQLGHLHACEPDVGELYFR